MVEKGSCYVGSELLVSATLPERRALRSMTKLGGE